MMAESEVHFPAGSRVPDGPVMGILTCKMVDGILWLFDAEGRRLDQVRSISVNQSADDITTATVVMMIGMERD